METDRRLELLKEFNIAFKKMQKELPQIDKNTQAFKYKYAPLEYILDKWEPVFDKHKFLLRQRTTAGGGDTDIVCTTLTHLPTGISDDASLTLPVSSDYQSVGSGVTYYKRYTLCSLVAKSPVGEDFDGLKEIPATAKKAAGKKKKPAEENLAKASDQPLENGDGGHVAFAFEEFVKDAKTVAELEKFWRGNEESIKTLDDDRASKIVETFAARKKEIIQQQKGK